jgi:hypothetical protein
MEREFVFWMAPDDFDTNALVKQYYMTLRKGVYRELSVYMDESKDCVIHNCYGPAFYEWDGKRKLVCAKYFTNGFLYRTHGPVTTKFNSDGDIYRVAHECFGMCTGHIVPDHIKSQYNIRWR